MVRRRTFFSLIIPIFLVVMARPRMPWIAIGVVLAVLGESLRIWAAGCISKNRELACQGPFAHVRNPLYLGSLLIAAGYCAMSGLWWSVLLMGALYYVFYVGAIFSEERHLETILGDAYKRYKKAVPRLVPRWSGYAFEGGSRFRWAQVWYNREQWSILGVVVFTALFFLRIWYPGRS